MPAHCHVCEHFRFLFFYSFFIIFFSSNGYSFRWGETNGKYRFRRNIFRLFRTFCAWFASIEAFITTTKFFLLPRSVLSWTSLPHSVIPFRLSFWFILLLIGSYVWIVDGYQIRNLHFCSFSKDNFPYMLNRFLSSILSNTANAMERGEYVYLQFQANWNREFISNASLLKSLSTVVWVMSSEWMHIPTGIIDGFSHTQWRFKYIIQFRAERKSIDGIYYSIDTCCSTFYAMNFYVLRFARHKILFPWRHWMRQCVS